METASQLASLCLPRKRSISMYNIHVITETDAISLSASPIPGAFLSFPLFNDQLLESPTDSDYFGKGEALTPSPVLVPVPQME